MPALGSNSGLSVGIPFLTSACMVESAFRTLVICGVMYFIVLFLALSEFPHIESTIGSESTDLVCSSLREPKFMEVWGHALGTLVLCGTSHPQFERYRLVRARNHRTSLPSLVSCNAAFNLAESINPPISKERAVEELINLGSCLLNRIQRPSNQVSLRRRSRIISGTMPFRARLIRRRLRLGCTNCSGGRLKR